jgi:hypothetical protein
MFQNICARITTSALLLAGSALLLGCSSSERQTSQSADSQAAEPSAPTVAAQPTPGTAEQTSPAAPAPGVRIFIDPTTGEAREPTAQEMAEMAKQSAAAKPGSKPQAVQLPDGTVMVPMEGMPQTPVQACLEKDGSLKVDHECRDQAKRQGGQQ